MNADRLPQVRIVDFAARQRTDHDARHLQHAQVLAHAVMRVFRIVHHAVGHQLASQVESIQVPFRAAVGDVTPERIRIGVRQTGEPVQHFPLDVLRVDAIRARCVGIPDVVDGELEEPVEFRVVEHAGTGIPDKRLCFAFHRSIQLLETRLLVLGQRGHERFPRLGRRDEGTLCMLLRRVSPQRSFSCARERCQVWLGVACGRRFSHRAR